MKKHIFIASGLIITFISPVISYYIPENNDIVGILASLFALLMIPSGVITIYSIKRLDKTETFSSILKKYSYSLLITLFFTLPIFLINN
jgi:type IV secretory pathway TrbL component